MLSYEQAVRKWACKQMPQRAISFADSLREDWKEPAVRERHFTTPLALYAKRPPPPPANPWKGGKGGGQDGKKGGGKTPGKTGKPKGANRTPDGKPICFRFQSKAGCRKGAKCHFAHVCCHCFGNHAGHACKTISAGAKILDATADTQGAASPRLDSNDNGSFRVLYLFSGKPRKGDMTQAMAKLAKTKGMNIIVECVDVQVGRKIDLSYPKVRQRYLA